MLAKKQLVTAILAALAVVLAAWLGGTKILGAHHFWSVKVALIGAPIGVALALLTTRLPRRIKTFAFVALTLASFAAAKWGQTEFANSYAENQLAGKFWYFGWIATTASMSGLLASLLASLQNRKLD